MVLWPLTKAVRAQDLPKLKLPWGTWEAQKYEPDPNVSEKMLPVMKQDKSLSVVF